jgi:hypothetical protein
MFSRLCFKTSLQIIIARRGSCKVDYQELEAAFLCYAHLSNICELLRSIIGEEPGYGDMFLGFPQSSQASALIVYKLSYKPTYE